MADRHMNLYHEQGKEGIYTCEICTKVFDNFFLYMQHKKREHNKQFGRKDVLQKHMKIAHENTSNEPVIDLWMIDGQKVTPVREIIAIKNH